MKERKTSDYIFFENASVEGRRMHELRLDILSGTTFRDAIRQKALSKLQAQGNSKALFGKSEYSFAKLKQSPRWRALHTLRKESGKSPYQISEGYMQLLSATIRLRLQQQTMYTTTPKTTRAPHWVQRIAVAACLVLALGLHRSPYPGSSTTGSDWQTALNRISSLEIENYLKSEEQIHQDIELYLEEGTEPVLKQSNTSLEELELMVNTQEIESLLY